MGVWEFPHFPQGGVGISAFPTVSPLWEQFSNQTLIIKKRVLPTHKNHYSFKHELVATFWVDAFSLGDSGLIPSFEIFLLFEFDSGFWFFVVPHS